MTNPVLIFGFIVCLFLVRCQAAAVRYSPDEVDLAPAFDWVVEHGGYVNHERVHFKSENGVRKGMFVRHPETLPATTPVPRDPGMWALKRNDVLATELNQDAWGVDPYLLRVPLQLALHEHNAQLQRDPQQIGVHSPSVQIGRASCRERV